MMQLPRFHLAFPVNDIAVTRDFYINILRCSVGRESERWIDFDFFGHQITAHLDETETDQFGQNQVDDHSIPSRHFGAILEWNDWDQLRERLKKLEIKFYIKPYTRFVGEIGEQRTFFVQDPCKNYLEFKCFKHPDRIFQSK